MTLKQTTWGKHRENTYSSSGTQLQCIAAVEWETQHSHGGGLLRMCFIGLPSCEGITGLFAHTHTQTHTHIHAIKPWLLHWFCMPNSWNVTDKITLKHKMTRHIQVLASVFHDALLCHLFTYFMINPRDHLDIVTAWKFIHILITPFAWRYLLHLVNRLFTICYN